MGICILYNHEIKYNYIYRGVVKDRIKNKRYERKYIKRYLKLRRPRKYFI